MDGANERTSLENSEPSLGDAEFVWVKQKPLFVRRRQPPFTVSVRSQPRRRGSRSLQQLPTTEKKRLLPTGCLSSQFVHLMVVTFLFSALGRIDFFL